MIESIVIVGACGTGKSSLVQLLQAHGYAARVVAQEHSAIPKLWAHGGQPMALIMLDASPDTITTRRQNTFPQWLYDQQRLRLRSAQAHATLYLRTDQLDLDDVQQRVMAHLLQLQIVPSTNA